MTRAAIGGLLFIRCSEQEKVLIVIFFSFNRSARYYSSTTSHFYCVIWKSENAVMDLPRRAACKADRLLVLPEMSVCDLVLFLEHSGGQGNKQQHECNSPAEMTASSVDALPSPPDAPIGLLAELDSSANTNWSFSKVAYRSPSLFPENEKRFELLSTGLEKKNRFIRNRKDII